MLLGHTDREGDEGVSVVWVDSSRAFEGRRGLLYTFPSSVVFRRDNYLQ